MVRESSGIQRFISDSFNEPDIYFTTRATNRPDLASSMTPRVRILRGAGWPDLQLGPYDPSHKI
jgi:hypothetical protein